MAHDLIYGKLARDWSCGKATKDATESTSGHAIGNVLDKPKETPQALGLAVRSEIQRNYDTIVRLTTTRRLPEAEQKAFRPFLQKWFKFALPKDGNFRSTDTLALLNFRVANQRFTERLALFEKLAKTPLKEPVKPETSAASIIPFSPPGSQIPESRRPWGLLTILGLAIGCLGYAFGRTKKE